jgi:hypothetical protein
MELLEFLLNLVLSEFLSTVLGLYFHNFREIRKQIIWRNKYIKYKGKCLVKVNWIKSGIIFINDILDEYGHISEYKIIAKLRNKQNWISELNYMLKYAFCPSLNISPI